MCNSGASPGKKGCCLLGMQGQICLSRCANNCVVLPGIYVSLCCTSWSLFLNRTCIRLPTCPRMGRTLVLVLGVSACQGGCAIPRPRLVLLRHGETWKRVADASRMVLLSKPIPCLQGCPLLPANLPAASRSMICKGNP